MLYGKKLLGRPDWELCSAGALGAQNWQLCSPTVVPEAAAGNLAQKLREYI